MNRGAVLRCPNVDEGHTEMFPLSQADLTKVPPDSWADLPDIPKERQAELPDIPPDSQNNLPNIAPDSQVHVLKINQDFSQSLCVLLNLSTLPCLMPCSDTVQQL